MPRWASVQAPRVITCRRGFRNLRRGDVRILAAARLLKPLGNPPPNSVKYFAAAEVLELGKDRAWLAKVTIALNQHWQKKNSAKRDLPNMETLEKSLSNRIPRSYKCKFLLDGCLDVAYGRFNQ